jgi:Na+/proline symporter
MNVDRFRSTPVPRSSSAMVYWTCHHCHVSRPCADQALLGTFPSIKKLISAALGGGVTLQSPFVFGITPHTCHPRDKDKNRKGSIATVWGFFISSLAVSSLGVMSNTSFTPSTTQPWLDEGKPALFLSLPISNRPLFSQVLTHGS